MKDYHKKLYKLAEKTTNRMSNNLGPNWGINEWVWFIIAVIIFFGAIAALISLGWHD